MNRRSFLGALLGTLVAIVATPLEWFLEATRDLAPTVPVEPSGVVQTPVTAGSVHDAMKVIFEEAVVDSLLEDTELLSVIYEEDEENREKAEPARFFEIQRYP